MSSKLIAAVASLVVAGPILVFPDLLPDTWRSGVVTPVTLAALGLGLVILHPWKKLRWGLWVFVLAVVASWAVMPVHDLLGLRHFAGIGVGVLAMAVVAALCTTSDRLIAATLLVALASTGILTLGLFSTYIRRTPKFIGVTRLAPAPLFAWLPELKLGLPGLEEGEEGAGHVNPNALGGTSLLLLPTCGGVAAAALVSGRRRRFTLSTGVVATTVAVVVLGMSLSRTAWIAALLTAVVLGLRWRRGRLWVLLVLLLLAAGLALRAGQSRLADPGGFDNSTRLIQNSVLMRVTIWQHGVRRLREAPWLGVGISQFHEVPRPTNVNGPMRVPHAHNTLLQVALDVGLTGFCGYVLLVCTLVLKADRAARRPGVVGRIAGGAGLSIVGVHLFGLGDAIALGAKVGLFQWLCAGLILAASHLPPTLDRSDDPDTP